MRCDIAFRLGCTWSHSDSFILSEAKDGGGGPDLEVNTEMGEDVVVGEERTQASDEGQLGDLASGDTEHSGRRKAKRSESAVGKDASQEEEGGETRQQERVGRRLRATVKGD